jgi:hypothetical protein
MPPGFSPCCELQARAPCRDKLPHCTAQAHLLRQSPRTRASKHAWARPTTTRSTTCVCFTALLLLCMHGSRCGGHQQQRSVFLGLGLKIFSSSISARACSCGRYPKHDQTLSAVILAAHTPSAPQAKLQWRSPRSICSLPGPQRPLPGAPAHLASGGLVSHVWRLGTGEARKPTGPRPGSLAEHL